MTTSKKTGALNFFTLQSLCPSSHQFACDFCTGRRLFKYQSGNNDDQLRLYLEDAIFSL